MEIILYEKNIKKVIKDFYKNNYILKSCKVDFYTENVQDRLKEVDLFYNGELHYNVLFKTIIKGKITDKLGNNNKFIEELDIEATKDLLNEALNERFDAKGLTLGFRYTINDYLGGLDVNFDHALVDIEKKSLKQKVFVKK
ncbi:MAG: hypothetical protein IKH54_00060 [Bacilli bacterium]|nr:hypothetical protein [Bacilli bacterium]